MSRRARLLGIVVVCAQLGGWVVWQPQRNTAIRGILCTSVVVGLAAAVAMLPRRAAWVSGLLLVLLATLVAGWPARPSPALGLAYRAALEAYSGTHYVWGGENRRGIDCSGYVRQALVDALVSEAWRTANPAQLREAAELWWRDASAESLRDGDGGRTREVQRATAINTLEVKALHTGDLAVTADGRHVLAYLGDGWFGQADPLPMKVHLGRAPDLHEPWFTQPVVVVRWKALSEP